jgi:hypothetical protein
LRYRFHRRWTFHCDVPVRFDAGIRPSLERGQAETAQIGPYTTVVARRNAKEMTMSPIQLLEAGRSVAERIPYSAVALISRFALASVFWR